MNEGKMTPVDTLKQSARDIVQALNAAKEALALTMKEFALAPEVVTSAAVTIRDSIAEYQKSNPVVSRAERRLQVFHLFDATLVDHGIDRPDICHFFEEAFDKLYPIAANDGLTEP